MKTFIISFLFLIILVNSEPVKRKKDNTKLHNFIKSFLKINNSTSLLDILNAYAKEDYRKLIPLLAKFANEGSVHLARQLINYLKLDKKIIEHLDINCLKASSANKNILPILEDFNSDNILNGLTKVSDLLETDNEFKECWFKCFI